MLGQSATILVLDVIGDFRIGCPRKRFFDFLRNTEFLVQFTKFRIYSTGHTQIPAMSLKNDQTFFNISYCLKSELLLL
jgi:hypothetical protein